jgi:ubiquinone/menaquinone biosynthesis C-methylase UbiE
MKLANITSTYRSKLIEKALVGWVETDCRVLDVGCGTGVVGDYLRKNLGLDLTGCDIDDYRITKIPFKKMTNMNELPFEESSFDVCFFIDMLHHTEYDTQIKLLEEGFRVTNIAFIFEIVETPLGKLFDYLLNKVHNPVMNIPYTYRSTKEWMKLGKELNTEVDVRTVPAPLWYPFSHTAFRLKRKDNY